MSEKEKFNKSVSVLVTAYLNNTLQHKNSCGCAVGNLIAAAMGLVITKPNNLWKDMGMGLDSDFWLGWQDTHPDWMLALDNYRSGGYSKETVERGLEQISTTGYSIEMIDRIERAFEAAFFLVETADERQYSGLMAVVDVLADIHHVELSDVNEAKAMFVKT